MTSSMTSLLDVSFGRTNDKKKLLALYDQIENAAKLWIAGGWLKEDYYRHFQMFSKDAKALKTRIDTHDYAPQDKIDERWLSTPPAPLPTTKDVR